MARGSRAVWVPPVWAPATSFLGRVSPVNGMAERAMDRALSGSIAKVRVGAALSEAAPLQHASAVVTKYFQQLEDKPALAHADSAEPLASSASLASGPDLT